MRGRNGCWEAGGVTVALYACGQSPQAWWVRVSVLFDYLPQAQQTLGYQQTGQSAPWSQTVCEQS